MKRQIQNLNLYREKEGYSKSIPESSAEDAIPSNDEVSTEVDTSDNAAENDEPAESIDEQVPQIDTPESLKGSYLFIRELANGAQGRIYLAISLKLQEAVVIKQLNIIHECIIPDEPEGHYQVGDVFPLIYKISKGYRMEIVMSMPFPFPYETMTPGDIIGKSYYEDPDSISNFRCRPINIDGYRKGDEVIRILY